MKRPGRIAAIVGGYLFAAIVAGIVVSKSPNANDPGGMAAFGDMLYFIATFTAVGSVPTGYSLWLLRSYRMFWNVLATLALVVAASGVVATAVYIATATWQPAVKSGWYFAAELTPLRLLAAPVLACAFGLAAILSPERRPRWALGAATSVELAITAYIVVRWFLPSR